MLTAIDRRVVIGVMGGSDPGAPAPILEDAETLGRLIAESGALLLCGGRTGVMEAAARGARSLPHGETVAILPGEDPRAANPHIRIAVATGMGIARNAINVLSSDALIAFPGGPGTLSEMAMALKCGIPLVGYRTWDVQAARPDLGAHGAAISFPTASTPEEAVQLALRSARQRPCAEEELANGARRVLKARSQALSRNDFEGFARCYHPLAKVIACVEGLTAEGAERIFALFRAALLGPERLGGELRLEEKRLSLIRLPGEALLAFYRGLIVSKGSVEKAWTCSTTFARAGGEYFILADHMSAAME